VRRHYQRDDWGCTEISGLVCAVVRSQFPSLIETKATETLMNAIAAAFSAAKDSLEQVQHLPEQAGQAAKTTIRS
jgi:hypothetical protein